MPDEDRRVQNAKDVLRDFADEVYRYGDDYMEMDVSRVLTDVLDSFTAADLLDRLEGERKPVACTVWAVGVDGFPVILNRKSGRCAVFDEKSQALRFRDRSDESEGLEVWPIRLRTDQGEGGQ